MRYAGSATTLTVELAHAAGGQVATTASLTPPAQDAVASAVASLSVPATVRTTPGAVVSMAFGAQALVAAGPVTLTFTAAGGASLSWLADGAVKAASGDAAAEPRTARRDSAGATRSSPLAA